MDYGEGDQDDMVHIDADDPEEDLYTDYGSVNIEDVHDVMFFHSEHVCFVYFIHFIMLCLLVTVCCFNECSSDMCWRC